MTRTIGDNPHLLPAKESLYDDFTMRYHTNLDGNSQAAVRPLDVVERIYATLKEVLRLCTTLAYTESATEKFAGPENVLDIGNLLVGAIELRTAVNELQHLLY